MNLIVLTVRTSFVRIDSISSSTISLNTGVPQGSALGPLLFTQFTTPLGDIISRFGLRFHQYADDTQIYIAVRRHNIACATSNLTACTSAVYDWLLHNILELNRDKSEAAIYGTASRVQSLKGDTFITVAGAPVKLSSLGVKIDENLTFNGYVRNICQASYYHIRGLRHIRTALSKDTTLPVASAIVGSRFDYCNALLIGISETNLDKLQHVQNTLARVVTETRRRDHISPVLADLHWLPIVLR